MLEDNAEEIKALALYFDQINIIEQRHLHIVAPVDAKPDKHGRVKAEAISTNDYTDERFLKHLKVFENENLIKYQIDIDGGGVSPGKGLLPVSSDMQINDLILGNSDLVGQKHNEKQTVDDKGRIVLSYQTELNKEAELISKRLFNKGESMYPLLSYYAKVFKTFVNYYEQGKNVLTTSKYINDLFTVINKTDRFKEAQKAFKNEFNVTPSFAYEAIKLGLPNLGKFPPEEILRFREKSKDELVEFQSKLELISLELLSKYDYDYINANAQKIADLKIKPLIESISKNLDNSKFKVIQDLVKEARDPKTYSPLLLTFSENISSSMIMLISAGLVGLNVGLEQYSRVKNAKQDGIYYLYKADRYFR